MLREEFLQLWCEQSFQLICQRSIAGSLNPLYLFKIFLTFLIKQHAGQRSDYPAAFSKPSNAKSKIEVQTTENLRITDDLATFSNPSTKSVPETQTDEILSNAENQETTGAKLKSISHLSIKLASCKIIDSLQHKEIRSTEAATTTLGSSTAEDPSTANANANSAAHSIEESASTHPTLKSSTQGNTTPEQSATSTRINEMSTTTTQDSSSTWETAPTAAETNQISTTPISSTLVEMQSKIGSSEPSVIAASTAADSPSTILSTIPNKASSIVTTTTRRTVDPNNFVGCILIIFAACNLNFYRRFRIAWLAL